MNDYNTKGSYQDMRETGKNSRKNNQRKPKTGLDWETMENNGYSDSDLVSGDTLEFLSLDDEIIEEYSRKTKKTASRKKASSGKKKPQHKAASHKKTGHPVKKRPVYEEEDVFEDEEMFEDTAYYRAAERYETDYEDEDEEDLESEVFADEQCEDEDFEGGQYEDEEFEDEFYEDEDYDEDEDDEDDEERGIFGRIGYFIAHMSPLDHVVTIFGCFIVMAAVVTGSLYISARATSKQVETFAEVGSEIENIGVIGESGLLAVSNAENARISQMLNSETETEPEQKELTANGQIEVGMNLASVQSDIKIKFVNKATNKLIGGVPFAVEVSGGGGSPLSLKDDDKDGIIYKTGIAAGTYTVKALALQGEEYAMYQMPAESTVSVTDKIAYQKIDVSDEIKTEAEVNVAAEDTAQQNTVEESALTDTVEWVESTKTAIDSDDNYQEIKRADIPDPGTIGKTGTGGTFRKMVEENPSGGGSGTEESGTGSETPTNPENPGGETSSGTTTTDPPIDPPPTSAGSTSTGTTSSDTTSTGTTSSGTTTTDPTSPPAMGSSNATPTDPTYTAVTISGASSIQVGETAQLSVATTPAGGTVTWSSSKAEIAKVDDSGKVTGVSVGTAEITAACGGISGKWTITVSAASVKYTAVKIEGDASIKVGKTGKVKATTTPAGGTVTWKSDNEKIVKIDSAGTMTGVAAGTATITGTCGDAKGTWKVTVTKDVSGDTKTKLKDKNGKQVYVKDANGKYVEATYADYYSDKKLYLQKQQASYFYTGWQTIDGYTYYYDKNGNYVTGDQVIQGAKYTFASDGKLSAGSGSMGIDVSKWNGSIDWNAVRNSGVSYVIIRCGYRGSSTGALIEDPKFRSNIQGAKAAGLKVGVYFFSQAVNEVEAVEEASMALNLVKGYGLNYPIFLDVESSGGRGDHVDVATRTAACRAFCATVQNSGYSAGIYANKTWLTSYINTGSLTSYKIWLAQYASAPSYTATKYDMWQYSSKGKVGGISGNVDMNISYMGY